MSIQIPQLRDYQHTAIDGLIDAILKGYRCPLLQIPTGGGKTTIMAELIRRAMNKSSRVLVMAHRKELILQIKDRLHLFGIFPGIIMAGWKQSNRPIMVASLQTLIKRDFPEVEIVIVDECHHVQSAGYKRILAHYPKAIIIGLTATPFRLDGKGLGDIFSYIVAPINVAQLIEAGHLVPAKYYGPKRDMSTEHTTGGDYNTAELFSKFDKTIIYDGVIQHYNKFAPGSKAIVFNVNVEHSKKMARLFNEHGISCAHLDGETPALERSQILADFRDGKYKVLCNANILTEGFDLPAIETVILNRKTKSKALYLQMIGRGLRPAPDKSHCVVIDQGANVWDHGPVDLDEEYSLESKKKNGGGAPPMKECPNCLLLQHAGAQACKECDYIFTLPIHERQLPQEVFEELDNLWMPKPIKAKPKIDLPAHLHKNYSDMNKEELKEVAALRGYKMGWVFVQLENQKQKQAA